jgi:hypothetical protein
VKHSVLGVAAVMAALIGSAAQAQVIDITQPNTTLAMVIGNQFQVGDKLFTVGTGGFSSATFNASDIFISPVINGDPATGEGFRLTGAWNDAPGGAASQFNLTYDVTVLPQFLAVGNRISMAELRFNGFATGAGSSAGIDANLTVEAQGAGTLSVFNNGTASQMMDDQSLNNLAGLRMSVTGSFSAAGDSGTAGASFMDLAFGRAVIPGPGSLACVLAGVGLVGSRRRR